MLVKVDWDLQGVALEPAKMPPTWVNVPNEIVRSCYDDRGQWTGNDVVSEWLSEQAGFGVRGWDHPERLYDERYKDLRAHRVHFVRDWRTGRIVQIELYGEQLSGRSVWLLCHTPKDCDIAEVYIDD